LTGTEAPGCDILSFENATDRNNFKSGKDRNTDQVKRFIEVKGRKSQGAKIELRGNEKDAARKYGDRYYLCKRYIKHTAQYPTRSVVPV